MVYKYLYNASSFSSPSATWSDRTSCSAQMCGSLRLRRACDRRGDKTRAAKLKHIYKLIHTHKHSYSLSSKIATKFCNCIYSQWDVPRDSSWRTNLHTYYIYIYTIYDNRLFYVLLNIEEHSYNYILYSDSSWMRELVLPDALSNFIDGYLPITISTASWDN